MVYEVTHVDSVVSHYGNGRFRKKLGQNLARKEMDDLPHFYTPVTKDIALA